MFRKWGIWWLLAAAGVCLVAASRGTAQTLRDALFEKQLPVQGATLANLDLKITSGAELDDASQFVIAYYLDEGSGLLKPPLYLDRYDRESKTWRSGELGNSTAKSEDLDAACLGSVLDITSVDQRLILETHINPSAGCALIVSKDLKLEATLYGWVLGHFQDGSIVYHRSLVHFATVHPSEIAVYDEKSKKDFTLFPPKSASPIRSRLASELREFFRTHQEYCAKANDPCDPEMFDSELEEKIALSDEEHALAFVISYELQGYGQDEKKPSGPARVVYVCRYANDQAKLEYRELLPEEVKTRFGDVSLQELLAPVRLKAVFLK